MVNQQTIGVPPDVPGATPQARTANYVNSILGILHAAYPTDTVVQILAQAPNINLDGSLRQAVTQFFTNAPDFELGSSRVDVYVQAHASSVFNGIAAADQPAVVAQVKRTQRLFQVSTNAETLAALMGTGLDSAHAIAQIPAKSFLARFAAALGGSDQAAALYQRAVAITTRSLHTFVVLKDALNGIQPRSITGDGIGVGSLPAGGAAVPLRNSRPQPAGQQHGRSLSGCGGQMPSKLYRAVRVARPMRLRGLSVGPEPGRLPGGFAAFPRRMAPNSNGYSPYDVLIGKDDGQGNTLLQGRRPDIAYLPLTCENTDTTLPYIDLVNEVLESYIVLGHADKSAAHDTGDATPTELDANPQNTNDAAYRTLVQAVYPFSLPYHRPIEIALAYLENLGSSRQAVLDAMKKDLTPTTLRAVMPNPWGSRRRSISS